IAIGTVVLFGTFSMFLYPLLEQASILQLSPQQFGLFAGASIHEVAQVLVAGSHINPTIAEIAVIVKMIRVLYLVPVLFIIAWLIQRQQQTKHAHKFIIPWFALYFLLVIVIHSINIIPTNIVN